MRQAAPPQTTQQGAGSTQPATNTSHPSHIEIVRPPPHHIVRAREVEVVLRSVVRSVVDLVQVDILNGFSRFCLYPSRRRFEEVSVLCVPQVKSESRPASIGDTASVIKDGT